MPLLALLLTIPGLCDDARPSEARSPELTWVSPQNCAWGSVPSAGPIILPFEISWDAGSDSETSTPEYQIGPTASTAAWRPFPDYDRSKTVVRNGRRYFTGLLLTNVSEAPDARSYVNGRWANGEHSTRPRAAFFHRGSIPHYQPRIVAKEGPAILPNARPASDGAHRFSIQADDHAPLVSISYQIGDGDWHFARDFAPGDISVSIPHAAFADARPGDSIPLRFKAFNGIAESAPSAPFTAVVNHPPEIIPNGDAPIVRDFGQAIEFPFEVVDPEHDPISMFYRIDDSQSWTRVEGASSPNLFPGAIFADLDPEVEHVLHVLAFDGTDESAPASFAFYDFLKRTGSFVRRVVRQAPPLVIVIGIGGIGRTSASDLSRASLEARLCGLRGRSIFVSSRRDRAERWSKAVNYPFGDTEIFTFGDASDPGLTAGQHTIEFKFEDESGAASTQLLSYTVNSPPQLQLLKKGTIPLTDDPSVALPVAVSDSDGDPVSLWYRFAGQNSWLEVPPAAGKNELPCEAFGDTKGVIELLAWDGCESSGEAVKVEYALEEAADDGGEGEVEPADDDEEAPSGLSPAALVGIIVGGVAVVCLGVALFVVVSQRLGRKKSSSTGLLEEE